MRNRTDAPSHLSQRSVSNMLVNQHSVASSYVQLRDEFHEEGSLCLKAQTINDIVYGQITLPRYCWPFINQPAMQRLKGLFQLGPNYMVFPGATHNRFEHSLGTAFLCDLQMNAL